jgi:CheY-specific phosphatase CheX
MPDPLLGSFIQVVCVEGPVLLGITGTETTCDHLAKLMLGMEPDEELPESEAFDAVGEIMNIVAGSMKTKLADSVGLLELGLPVFLSGQLHAVGNIVVQNIEVTVGSDPCNLLVFAITGNRAG